jgi:hypothetical protein
MHKIQTKKTKYPWKVVFNNGNNCHAWNMVKVKGKWWWVDTTFHLYRKKETMEYTQ